MWNLFAKRRKKSAAPSVPPEGLGRESIATESSVCTGETLIGFRAGLGGKLQNAVVVHGKADIDAFYRAYGYEPPQE